MPLIVLPPIMVLYLLTILCAAHEVAAKIHSPATKKEPAAPPADYSTVHK